MIVRHFIIKHFYNMQPNRLFESSYANSAEEFNLEMIPKSAKKLNACSKSRLVQYLECILLV